MMQGRVSEILFDVHEQLIVGVLGGSMDDVVASNYPPMVRDTKGPLARAVHLNAMELHHTGGSSGPRWRGDVNVFFWFESHP